ncbi:MAG TPA: TAXI family TRAP transporter solute-binding subunit [Vicinamibacteria bacterium]|nr:TAXI family TRAP transporter solute-binding subunit [Vicinamibacteria bacterium]
MRLGRLVLVSVVLLPTCRSADSTPDSMLVIAVGQPGSVLNALGTGIAKLVTERTNTEARVRVTSGMDALVGAGDAEIGVSASDSAHLSSRGLRHYEGQPQKKLRLLLPGPPLLLGFVVRRDSAYRTLGDLKGARVPGEYPNARPMYHDGVAMLGTVGLSWEDLDVLPVASFRDGIQALIEGRADAAIGSVGSGLVQQADASLDGVRFLSLPGGQEISEGMWDAEPGFHAVPVPSGFSLGVEEDMWLAGKEAYVTVNADVSGDLAYRLVRLLWDNMESLRDVHPFFERWTHEHMVNAKVTIPFHDGTIRFLKEIGEWTPEHEAAHHALSDQLK